MSISNETETIAALSLEPTTLTNEEKVTLQTTTTSSSLLNVITPKLDLEQTSSNQQTEQSEQQQQQQQQQSHLEITEDKQLESVIEAQVDVEDPTEEQVDEALLSALNQQQNPLSQLDGARNDMNEERQEQQQDSNEHFLTQEHEQQQHHQQQHEHQQQQQQPHPQYNPQMMYPGQEVQMPYPPSYGYPPSFMAPPNPNMPHDPTQPIPNYPAYFPMQQPWGMPYPYPPQQMYPGQYPFDPSMPRNDSGLSMVSQFNPGYSKTNKHLNPPSCQNYYMSHDIENSESQHRPPQSYEIVEHRKFPCTLCEKKFTRPSTLRTHMNSHTGERPYACHGVGCKWKFSVSSNLNRHIRVCPILKATDAQYEQIPHVYHKNEQVNAHENEEEGEESEEQNENLLPMSKAELLSTNLHFATDKKKGRKAKQMKGVRAKKMSMEVVVGGYAVEEEGVEEGVEMEYEEGEAVDV